MKFEENLRELRKQNGLSQEELAEQLNVSRQAVSKWENGSGYPELDKLMSLCERFRCSLDDLLKGDVKERSLVCIERYEKHHNTMSKIVTLSIFIIISAVTAGAFLQDAESKSDEMLMGGIVFTLITIGVLLIVYYSMTDEAFKKKYPNVPEHVYTEEEIEAWDRKYRISTIVGVGIILISFVIEQFLEYVTYEYIANGIFMILLSIAVSIFVYFGMQKSKYDATHIKTNPEKKKQEALIGKCCSVIMLLATIIFFVWGMAFHGWALSWLAYVVGGISCAIVAIVLRKEE